MPSGEAAAGGQVTAGQVPLGLGAAAERGQAQLRLGVGQRQDGPGAAEQPGRHDQRGRAGVEPAVPAVQGGQQPGHVPGGVLGPLHRQLFQHVEGDAGRRHPREVVGQQGQVTGRVGHSLVEAGRVLDPARRAGQHRVGPGVGGGPGQGLSLLGGGGGGARYQRHPGHGGPDRGEQPHPLIVVQGVGLAGGPGHHDGLQARGDQPGRVGGGAVEVDLTVVVEQGDEGGANPAERRRIAGSRHNAIIPGPGRGPGAGPGPRAGRRPAGPGACPGRRPGTGRTRSGPGPRPGRPGGRGTPPARRWR